MSFSNFAFPNTNVYDSDLRELIAMYKKLVKDYSSIKAEIDQAVDFINNFKTYVNDIVSEIIDGKLNVVNAKLEAITEAVKRIDLNIDEIENNVTDLYTDIDELRNNFNSEMIAIRLEIAEIYKAFADYKHSIDDIIAHKVQEMLLYIDEHVQQIERLYVVNPMTGEYENIQNVLDMFAEYISMGYGLTADEYDSLNLTAFKRLKMTMNSPFTGEIDSYDNIIYMLANLHKDAFTADEYDAKLFTSDVYDGFAISAYNYDWHGKTMLTTP